VRGDGQGAVFERQADGLRLGYDQLQAQDAQGRTLPARMELDGGALALLVDDARAVYPLTIDPILTQQQKLTAADGAAVDRFGAAVVLSGDTAVIGASSDDVTGADQGSAYVFTRSGAVWTQSRKLTANDGAANENFGFSVALSGDTLAVGASRDEVGANTAQGSAYVFTRGGAAWALQQKLTANDGASGDFFGFSVALSGDTVVVGAEGGDIGANGNQGAAYVFARGGTDWTQQRKLTASDGAAGDSFGFSVALSGDTVLAGALNDAIGANTNQGAAYVFVCPACPTIALTPDSLPGGVIGNPYSQTVTASGAAGPYQFSLSDGALPPGLSLAQNGLLSGTPTAAGTYRFTITATILSSLCPGSRDYTLTVTGASCPTLTINPDALPVGQSGAAYSQQLSASGGAAPYSFAVSAGVAPNGISLSAAGLLSGAPTASGTFNFTARATGANGCQGTRAYALTIGSSACNFSVAPVNHAFSSEGGNGVISVNAADGCAWTALGNDPMITITSGANGSGNGAVRFAVSKNPNTTSRQGLLTIAGRKVTVVQAAPIACVSAASFVGNSLATESIVAAFGNGLAKGVEVATTQPLPETLAGTRVSVMDSLGTKRFAALFFVSPGQINFQVPPGTAAGQALLTIIHDDETSVWPCA